MKTVLLTFNNAELNVELASSISTVPEADVTLMIDEESVEGMRHRLADSVTLLTHYKPRLRQPFRQLRYVYTLVKQLREINPDVLHIQIGHLWFNFALPFLRKYPRVITVHDPRDHTGDVDSRKTPQFLKDYGYKSSDHLIVHSDEMKPYLQEALDLPSEKVSVVPLTALGDADLATEVDEVKNTILFFGRIFEYKGLEYLIQAEPIIREQVPDAKIVIAGRGDGFDKYRKMMQNPDGFIVHNHYIETELQSTLFRQASVVVLPYIEATQSGVIPAAYNFSKPVVATRVGGLHNQIDDDKTGFLVEPRNVEAIAEKVIYLLQNEKARYEMGANGRHKLETEWSAEAIGRQTVAAYQKAIDSRQGHSHAVNTLHESASKQ